METVGKAAGFQATMRFDMAERGRMRAVLLRYMEAHGIGVPTLQARIAEAADRSVDLIPLKTLQRFLAGASRTNDAFLIPCHRFASALPGYAGPAEMAPDILAELVGRFFGPGQAAAGLRAEAGDLRGDYDLWTTRKIGPGVRLATDRNKYPIPYASLAIGEASGSDALAASERVVNPARLDSFKPEDGETRHRWEGGLVSFGSGSFVLLRNSLTRLPKCYGVSRTNPNLYEGYAIETPFLVPDGKQTADMSPLNLALLPRRDGIQK